MADIQFDRKTIACFGMFNLSFIHGKLILLKDIKLVSCLFIFMTVFYYAIAPNFRNFVTFSNGTFDSLNFCFVGFNVSFTSNRLVDAKVDVDTQPSDYENVCRNESKHLCYGEKNEVSLIVRPRQRTKINPDIKGEALRALNQALDMQQQGKTKMANKLFVHAHKMDPAHADILNHYGEFMELHIKDVVLADHFYSKALLIEPDHSKAVANRQRTLPVVESLDKHIFNDIEQKLQLLHKVPKSHPGLRRASKEAYFYHIYHTNAIEGNTLTLSQTRVIIETRTAIGGKSLAEQNEALGTSSAMNYINNNLINRVGRLTLQHILDIHRRVLGHVDPIDAGQIRKTHVAVGNYDPPAPRMLDKLLDSFITWLNSEDAYELHPIEFAAIAHYRLVAIHPFYDGNGRTARLLMNLILMQFGYPPVTIKVDDRLRYYETLEQANDGDIRPFTRFIAECASVTLEKFLLSTHEDYTPSENRLFGEEQRIITAL